MITIADKATVASLKNRLLNIQAESITPIYKGYQVALKNAGNEVRYNADLKRMDIEKHDKAAYILEQIFQAIVNANSAASVLLDKYDSCLFGNQLINKKIARELKNNGIQPKDAILTDDNNLLLELFDSAIKSSAWPIIITLDENLAIIPTDHLDIFVAFDRDEQWDSVANRINENEFATYFEILRWE